MVHSGLVLARNHAPYIAVPTALCLSWSCPALHVCRSSACALAAEQVSSVPQMRLLYHHPVGQRAHVHVSLSHAPPCNTALIPTLPKVLASGDSCRRFAVLQLSRHCISPLPDHSPLSCTKIIRRIQWSGRVVLGGLSAGRVRDECGTSAGRVWDECGSHISMADGNWNDQQMTLH